jgi:L-malate glycosyltransferase
MKTILLLASTASVHTVRWANAISQSGFRVVIVSLENTLFDFNSNIEIFVVGKYVKFGNLKHFFSVKEVKELVKRVKPDLIHAHYATGYAYLLRKTQFHPAIVSVWGTDVLVFPEKSSFHRNFVIKNLEYADHICATSKIMARKVNELLPNCNHLSTIPFGVDSSIFYSKHDQNQQSDFVIGTTKAITKGYGGDRLIQCFLDLYLKFYDRFPDKSIKIKLLLVGGKYGEFFEDLKKKYFNHSGWSSIEFLGHIENSELPSVLSRMNLFLCLSRSESFGVSVLEAEACEVPVICTNIGGLPEVVSDKNTGFLVEESDLENLPDVIIDLIFDKETRVKLGRNAREFVIENYEWSKNVLEMCRIYLHQLNM